MCVAIINRTLFRKIEQQRTGKKLRMSDLKQSGHFISRADLVVVEPEQTLQEVYHTLSQAQRGGGFVLGQPGDKAKYVRADRFAKAVQGAVGNNLQEWERFSATPVGDLINRFPSVDILVDVDENRVETSVEESPLQNRSDRVFAVVEEGRFVGWYLNHETVHDASTSRTVFVCSRGHSNPDPDHGTCYSCPSPIKSTREEGASSSTAEAVGTSL